MRYYSWEKLAKRFEEFEGKNIDELSIEEIEEYLEMRKQCKEISQSLSKVVDLFINAFKKQMESNKQIKQFLNDDKQQLSSVNVNIPSLNVNCDCDIELITKEIVDRLKERGN